MIELLDRPIAFQRIFVNLTGSINAALFLSQAVYCKTAASVPAAGGTKRKKTGRRNWYG